MVPEDVERPFGEDEWATCLKVLEALGEQPDAAPDRERIERLVARLYRKTRRGRRKTDAEVRRREDRALVEGTGRVRAAPGHDRSQVDRAGDIPAAGLLRSKSRRCYICKDRYREVHPFYHLLCPPCARLNEAKRDQRADLSGRRAIVTGGRIGRHRGRAEAPPGWGRGPGHDPFPKRGRPPLRPGAGLRLLGGPGRRIEEASTSASWRPSWHSRRRPCCPSLPRWTSSPTMPGADGPPDLRLLRRGRSPGADASRGTAGERQAAPRCRSLAGAATGVGSTRPLGWPGSGCRLASG